MTTSHFCKGKWRPGSVADCSHHTRLSKKQTSVYRSGDDRPAGPKKAGDPAPD